MSINIKIHNIMLKVQVEKLIIENTCWKAMETAMSRLIIIYKY